MEVSLIGRSLRSVVDLNRLGSTPSLAPRHVLQADGGTQNRQYHSLGGTPHDALYSLVEKDILPRLPAPGSGGCDFYGLCQIATAAGP